MTFRMARRRCFMLIIGTLLGGYMSMRSLSLFLLLGIAAFLPALASADMWECQIECHTQALDSNNQPYSTGHLVHCAGAETSPASAFAGAVNECHNSVSGNWRIWTVGTLADCVNLGNVPKPTLPSASPQVPWLHCY